MLILGSGIRWSLQLGPRTLPPEGSGRWCHFIPWSPGGSSSTLYLCPCWWGS